MSDQEHFPIDDVPGYTVTREGDVWSWWSRKGGSWWVSGTPIRKVAANRLGNGKYLRVSLYGRDGKQRGYQIHRLVQLAVVGDIPDPLKGRSSTAEYQAWAHMRDRCGNPRSQCFDDYGGRGITVCDRWRHFANFIADMGERPTPRHTLERIDNDAGYSPENCRWATVKEQLRNTRQTRFVTWNGERRALIDLSDEHGLEINTVKYRLRRGWSLERALTTPAKQMVQLTREDATQIRALKAAGEPTAIIAERFGISRGHARSILCGIAWRE